jgi:hypothetical protein
VQTADALFREGRAAMKAGDLDVACPKLEKSYQLEPAPGAAVNLGDCFDKQGKVGSALLAYQAARKLLKAGDPRIGPVDKQIAALEKRAPKLTITLAPDAPEGTRVTRDGKGVDFSDFGRALPMNPGEVVIVVTAPGRPESEFRVVLTEGANNELVVTPPELSGKTRTHSGNEDSRLSRTHDSSVGPGAAAVGVGVAGLAGLAIGTIALVQASNKCPTNSKCSGSDHDSASTWQTVGIVSLIVGGGGIAAAVLLWGNESGQKQSDLAIAPVVASDGAGVVVGKCW